MPSNISKIFNKEKYTIKELAYLCNKNYYYVLRNIKDGLLEAQKIGKTYIISKDEAKYQVWKKRYLEDLQKEQDEYLKNK